MPPFLTFCPTCQTERPAAIAEKGNDAAPYGHVYCTHCEQVIWAPIAWDSEGNAVGWQTRVIHTFWRNVPPEDKFTCLDCGFTWLRSEGSVCPVCEKR